MSVIIDWKRLISDNNKKLIVDISAETWEELQSFVDRVCRPVTTAQAQSNWVALDGITGILCVRACMFLVILCTLKRTSGSRRSSVRTSDGSGEQLPIFVQRTRT